MITAVPAVATDEVGRPPLGASGYGWYVALVLSFAHFVSFIDRFVMSLVLGPVKAAFDVSDTQLGLLQGTGFVILYCVAAIPLGSYVDRGNRRNLIIAGILCWSVATAACGLARSFEQLFLARIAVGLGEACLVPAALSMIVAYFPGHTLGRAVSVFSTGATAGASAALIGGGLLLGWLVTQPPLTVPGVGPLLPWQTLFVLAALPGILSAALMASVREPARLATTVASAGLREALAHVRANARAFALHTAGTCAVVILYQAFAAWTPTFLVRHFGLAVPESGLLVGLVLLVAGPLGNLLGGVLIDRFHRAGRIGAPGLTIALAMAVAIVPGAVFCLSDNLVVAMLAWGLLMTCIAMGVPAALTGMQLITPDAQRGVTSGLFLAVYTLIGVGLGPTLVGVLTDHVFGDPLAVGQSLLAVVLVVATLGTVVALLGRRPTEITHARIVAA